MPTLYWMVPFLVRVNVSDEERDSLPHDKQITDTDHFTVLS